MPSPAFQTYIVGGAVRDQLLGLPVRDRDWVVVGATVDDMLAAGFQPVGADFPVFLHPQTREQHALARTERKTAPGYRGFVVHADPSVTLDEDLRRRDLTINAMAMTADGVLIDPCHGQADLQARVLRHVSPAFVEDPVRILRLARFAARFADFTVAAETVALMRQMVAHGEADALVPERVWQELSTGLMEAAPARLLDVLRGCGALARVLPEVDRLWARPPRADGDGRAAGEAQGDVVASAGAHLRRVLVQAARLGTPLAVRFACLARDVDLVPLVEAAAASPVPSEPLTPPMPPTPPMPATTSMPATPSTSPVPPAPAAAPAPPVPVATGRLRALCQRLRVPDECRQVAELTVQAQGLIATAPTLDAEALVQGLERCDALRRPHRLADALLASECDTRARPGREKGDYPPRRRLMGALAIARSVDTAAVARACAQRGETGPQVGVAVHRARVDAVGAWLQQPWAG